MIAAGSAPRLVLDDPALVQTAIKALQRTTRERWHGGRGRHADGIVGSASTTIFTYRCADLGVRGDGAATLLDKAEEPMMLCREKFLDTAWTGAFDTAAGGPGDRAQTDRGSSPALGQRATPSGARSLPSSPAGRTTGMRGVLLKLSSGLARQMGKRTKAAIVAHCMRIIKAGPSRSRHFRTVRLPRRPGWRGPVALRDRRWSRNGPGHPVQQRVLVRVGDRLDSLHTVLRFRKRICPLCVAPDPVHRAVTFQTPENTRSQALQAGERLLFSFHHR